MIPAIADLPPMMQERVVCSIAAAAQYQIPANVVLAVAETEGGRPGQWVQNTNGTHDVGPMQFNTSYLGTLARYGITTADVAASGCYPYQLAAWRLALHLQNDAGDVWQRAANYHSRTPQYNAIYRGKLLGPQPSRLVTGPLGLGLQRREAPGGIRCFLPRLGQSRVGGFARRQHRCAGRREEHGCNDQGQGEESAHHPSR